MFLTKSDHYKSQRTIYEQICTKTLWCWGNQAGLRKLLPAADLSPGSILFNVKVSLTSILHHPTRLFTAARNSLCPTRSCLKPPHPTITSLDSLNLQTGYIKTLSVLQSPFVLFFTISFRPWRVVIP